MAWFKRRLPTEEEARFEWTPRALESTHADPTALPVGPPAPPLQPELTAPAVHDGLPSSRSLVIGPDYRRDTLSVSGPARTAFRPDTVLDGWHEPSGVALLAASVRGEGHRRARITRQDDFAVLYDAELGRVIIAVADGVSAATHSHLGSAAACRYATQWIDGQCKTVPAADIPWTALAEQVAWQVKTVGDRLAETADGQSAAQSEADARHRAAALVATTLTCVVLDVHPDGTLRGSGVCIGDSGIHLLSGQDYLEISGLKHADDAGLTSSAVLPLPYFAPDLVHAVEIQVVPGEHLLVGTDGVWDALGAGGGPLGDALSRVLHREQPSMLEFGHIVDFVKESFDDDRTLVAVWPTWSADEGH